jgi:hypothetical protein
MRVIGFAMRLVRRKKIATFFLVMVRSAGKKFSPGLSICTPAMLLFSGVNALNGVPMVFGRENRSIKREENYYVSLH